MAELVRAALFGASGQGKTTQARYFLATKKPARLLCFDPMDEYGASARRCGTLADLLARSRGAEAFALRYVPPRGEGRATIARFEAFCSIAFELGNLTMLCEELQLVTKPGWAPPAWSECTLRGRHKGLSILGLSQRPALVDKNFLSNAGLLSTCRLNFEDDVACMARMLGVERDRVLGLPRYAFIVRDMETGSVTEGTTGPLLPVIAGLARARKQAGKQK